MPFLTIICSRLSESFQSLTVPSRTDSFRDAMSNTFSVHLSSPDGVNTVSYSLSPKKSVDAQVTAPLPAFRKK